MVSLPGLLFLEPKRRIWTRPEHPLPVQYSQALDYELEVACVIRRPGINIRAEEAVEYIVGYTILNDWSARDIQRRETRVGLGPAKAKDFALSLGPWLVTPDELADRASRPARGLRSDDVCPGQRGRAFARQPGIDALLLRRDDRPGFRRCWLLPGDVLGSGTVGTGCLLELTRGQGPWLEPGDVVELEIERLGVLRNTDREISAPAWTF